MRLFRENKGEISGRRRCPNDGKKIFVFKPKGHKIPLLRIEPKGMEQDHSALR